MRSLNEPSEEISALNRGEATSADLVGACLERISRRDGELGVFVHVAGDEARQAAQASDVRRRHERALSALDGVPVALKANFAVRGMPLHAGIGHFRDRRADADAWCVARLREAGAIIVGLVNMHEAASGATTDNPWFGRTRNPCAPDRTAGGSSGGSAAAVAAGYVPLALGSDTVGSTRIPAAFTGTVGLKPAFLSIPTEGLMPLALGFDTVGIHGRSLADCRTLLALLSREPDEQDRPLNAVGLASFLDEPDLDDRVVAAISVARRKLEDRGIAVSEVHIPVSLSALVRAIALFCAGDTGALYPELAVAQSGVSEILRQRLAWAAGQPYAAFVDARGTIERARQAISDALFPFDGFLMPATPGPAPRFDEPIGAVAAFTAPANATGLPAIALPGMPDPSQLPVSVQLVARTDHKLLELAGMIF